MCVNKESFEKFQEEMKEDVRQVMHDIKGIRTSQQLLGELSQQTEEHLRELNSRTSKIEARTDNLEDAEFREVRCIQKEVIGEIKNSMLTVEKFEEWELKKQKEKEKEQAKKMHAELVAVQALDARQRRMQWVISGIVGLGTIIMAVIASI